jgi:hypothetical protein
MITILKAIAEEMNIIGIPYEFMEWTDPVQYPYFVGEYSEVATSTEDGYKEVEVIVTGTTRASWMDLEQAKSTIEDHFHRIHGLRKSVEDGTVVIYYTNSFPVPTGEADLKRIQINLLIKKWKGMN